MRSMVLGMLFLTINLLTNFFVSPFPLFLSLSAILVNVNTNIIFKMNERIKSLWIYHTDKFKKWNWLKLVWKYKVAKLATGFHLLQSLHQTDILYTYAVNLVSLVYAVQSPWMHDPLYSHAATITIPTHWYTFPGWKSCLVILQSVCLCRKEAIVSFGWLKFITKTELNIHMHTPSWQKWLARKRRIL